MIRGSGIFGLFDINFDDIIARFRREPAVIQFLTGNFISLIIIKLPIDDIISIDLSIVRCHFSGCRVKLEVNIRVDHIFLCPFCSQDYIIVRHGETIIAVLIWAVQGWGGFSIRNGNFPMIKVIAGFLCGCRNGNGRTIVVRVRFLVFVVLQCYSMAMCVPMGIQGDVAADGFCKCIFYAAFCLCIPAKKCITFSYRVGGNYKRLVIRVAFCSS